MKNNNQSGRSMIEMLGVLAIIGVLSVGGIAGYSKAMMKFKINKSIDQVSQIVANTRTLYARQKNYKSINNKIMYKANLAPREMFEDSGSGSYAAINPFGGGVGIGPAAKSSNDHKAFMVSYYNVPDEACIELVTQDWGDNSSSGLIAISVNYPSSADGSFLGVSCQSNTACPHDSNTYPMPVDKAVDYCSRTSNSIHWKFY